MLSQVRLSLNMGGHTVEIDKPGKIPKAIAKPANANAYEKHRLGITTETTKGKALVFMEQRRACGGDRKLGLVEL